MPSFEKARDGHFYIRHGYPWENDTGDQPMNVVYQIYPKGEQVFDFLRWTRGEKIPKTLFYALLVEGSIGHGNLREPVNITFIPYEIWSRAADEADGKFKEYVKKLYMSTDLALFRIVQDISSLKLDFCLSPLQVVNFASKLYLGCRWIEENNQRNL